MISGRPIIPNLWFDRQAEEAAGFYTALFARSRTGRAARASKAGFEIHGIPEGTLLNVEFEIAGQRFIAINGGPIFKFTPAVSYLVACDTKEQVDAIWARLSQGGAALMELGEYPFSGRYGWTQDRFGVSWQVMLMGDRPARQLITPTLMFVGEQAGRAEAAIGLYTSLFNGSALGDISRYGPGEEPDTAGSIRHASFTIEGQEFAAMDSAHQHEFSFSEANSFLVECETQNEIDYYWDQLTAGGGQEGMCGWLKDRFGVSWQVAPAVLAEMLRDGDTQKVERVTNAFLAMQKFDLAALRRAYEGKAEERAASMPGKKAA